MFLKINNIRNSSGKIDYKGLDINRFIAGTQCYPYDCTSCCVASEEQDINNKDVEIITEEQYYQHKSEFEESIKKNNPVSLEEKIKIQEAAILELAQLLSEVTNNG